MWPLQEAAGTTAAADASGFGRNGTYASASMSGGLPIIAGADAAATFPGTANVSVPDGAWMDVASWTYEVAVQSTSWSSYRSLGSRDPASGADRIFSCYILTGDSLGWAWNTGGTQYSLTTSGSACSINTTYLIAMRWDSGASTLSQWRNGLLWRSMAVAGNAKTGAQPLTIGSAGPNFYVAGRMSHAAFYGAALSDARLLAHAQAAGLA